MTDRTLYEKDFHAWTLQQAAILRAGRLAEADVEHLAEEIESMGRSEQRELENRLTVLVLHLLKWRYQPSHRGNSWRYSIMEQRRKIARHMRQNPSLQAVLAQTLADSYGDALIEAARETGLDLSVFPPVCPWSYETMMDDDFWPENG